MEKRQPPLKRESCWNEQALGNVDTSVCFLALMFWVVPVCANDVYVRFLFCGSSSLAMSKLEGCKSAANDRQK